MKGIYILPIKNKLMLGLTYIRLYIKCLGSRILLMATHYLKISFKSKKFLTKYFNI